MNWLKGRDYIFIRLVSKVLPKGSVKVDCRYASMKVLPLIKRTINDANVKLPLILAKQI